MPYTSGTPLPTRDTQMVVARVSQGENGTCARRTHHSTLPHPQALLCMQRRFNLAMCMPDMHSEGRHIPPNSVYA